MVSDEEVAMYETKRACIVLVLFTRWGFMVLFLIWFCVSPKSRTDVLSVYLLESLLAQWAFHLTLFIQKHLRCPTLDENQVFRAVMKYVHAEWFSMGMPFKVIILLMYYT